MVSRRAAGGRSPDLSEIDSRCLEGLDLADLPGQATARAGMALAEPPPLAHDRPGGEGEA